MSRFIYSGPVMEFDRLVASNWRGETVAESISKARSNLTYQFKKQNNRLPGCKISLPGVVIEETNRRLT